MDCRTRRPLYILRELVILELCGCVMLTLQTFRIRQHNLDRILDQIVANRGSPDACICLRESVSCVCVD
jgi:hypothetical protein